MTSMSPDRMAARLKVVDEHVRLENHHDLEGIMGTFGATAHYDDEPWGMHYIGRGEVRTFYEGLLQALPGLQIDVLRHHARRGLVKDLKKKRANEVDDDDFAILGDLQRNFEAIERAIEDERREAAKAAEKGRT